MTDTEAPRALASGVTITLLGMISWQADVLPARRTARPSTFRLTCPECEDATPVHQQYTCPSHHGPFTQDQLVRAVSIDADTLCKVDADHVAVVKGDTAENKRVAELKVYPADQVEAATMPGESVYRLRPHGDKKRGVPSVTAQTYAMVLNLVADPNVAFVANFSLRGTEKMYRVISRDGMLTMVELVRPGEFHAPIDVPCECDPKLQETAAEFVKLQMTDFDPHEWVERRSERAEELKAQLLASDTEVVPAKAPQAEDATVALMAQLEASLALAKADAPAAAKPKAKPRKRAATAA